MVEGLVGFGVVGEEGEGGLAGGGETREVELLAFALALSQHPDAVTRHHPVVLVVERKQQDRSRRLAPHNTTQHNKMTRDTMR